MDEKRSLQDHEEQDLLLGLLPPNYRHKIIKIDLKQCYPTDFQFTLEIMVNEDRVSRDFSISVTWPPLRLDLVDPSNLDHCLIWLSHSAGA